MDSFVSRVPFVCVGRTLAYGATPMTSDAGLTSHELQRRARREKTALPQHHLCAHAPAELRHLMQAQYAALISIANAVKAVPPPPRRDPLPAIDESLRSENAELRRVGAHRV